MIPGLTRWMRMSVPSRSTASDSMNALIAALVALYAASRGGPSRAATDDTVRMRPLPRSTMRGNSASVSRTGEK